MIDATAAQIAPLYREVFGREPDAVGLDWWDKSGASLDEVKAGFYGSPEYAKLQADQANRSALSTGLQGAEQSYQQAQQRLDQGLSQATGTLQPWMQQGQQAFGVQSALSGALGADAQRQAFSDFVSSPGQEWLQQQGEQAVTRQASALGGLGGGNVQKELARFGQGLAQQDLQNQFDRLGYVSGMGGQAASQLAGSQVGVGQYGAGMGQGLANLRYDTGNRLSQIAQQKAQQQATQLGTAGGNLANLLGGAGTQQAASQQNLAQLLGNLASQTSGQVAGLPGIPGTQQQGGMLGGIGQLAGGIGGLAEGFGWGQAAGAAGAGAGAAGAGAGAGGMLSGLGALVGLSDKRLKANIEIVGATKDGHNLYIWDWTEDAKRIVGDQPSFGVIAQEVESRHPEAVSVGGDGYLRVDYSRIN